MNDGIYALYYTGIAGSGLGIAVLRGGMLAGADMAGGTYDGTLAADASTGRLAGNIRMNVAAGTSLVTGAPVSDVPHTIEFPVALPSDFGDGRPVEIRLPTGPVNIIFRKLRDLPA